MKNNKLVNVPNRPFLTFRGLCILNKPSKSKSNMLEFHFRNDRNYFLAFVSLREATPKDKVERKIGSLL